MRRARRLPDKHVVLPLSPQEHATIMAALRLYQARLRADDVDHEIEEIAAGGGNVVPMDPDDVHTLCVRLCVDGTRGGGDIATRSEPVAWEETPAGDYEYRERGWTLLVTRGEGVWFWTAEGDGIELGTDAPTLSEAQDAAPPLSTRGDSRDTARTQTARPATLPPDRTGPARLGR